MTCRITTAAIAILLLKNVAVHAGPLADTFGPGLFGVKWGATKTEVEAVHPNGKWHHSPVDSYQIDDSRPIFGMERKKQKITFAFASDDRLTSMAIYFGGGSMGYANVLHFMTEQFGPPLRNENEKIEENYGFGTTLGARWPADGQINVTLLTQIAAFSQSTFLLIQRTADSPKDRAALGLE